MASNINVVVLAGRLTRDPELKHLPNGTAVAEMGLAVNRSRKVEEEWVEEVSFFDLSFYGRSGENAARKLQKGDAVSVKGSLRQRTWEAEDGTKREKVSVNVESMEGEGFFRPASENSEPVGAVAASQDDIPF